MPFIEHIPPSKQKRCRSTEHNPPSLIVLKPGTHKWKCPNCGLVQTIIVPDISYLAGLTDAKSL